MKILRIVRYTLLISMLFSFFLVQDICAKDKTIIHGFEHLSEQDQSIKINKEEKYSLEELTEMMPDTLSAFTVNGYIDIAVEWKCIGEDYGKSDAYYFQFSPKWDENKYELTSELDYLQDTPYISVFLYDGKTSKGRAVTSNANETTIYNFLKNQMGLNTAAACGVLANIYHESSFNPYATGDSGTSYGICQWHNSRWNAMKTWCNNNGYDWRNLTGQLNYLKFELSQNNSAYLWNGKTIYNYIKSVSNTAQGAYDAGYYWCYYFEVPANKGTVSVTRGNLAKNTYWPAYNKVTPTLSVEGASFPDIIQQAKGYASNGRIVSNEKITWAWVGILNNSTGQYVLYDEVSPNATTYNLIESTRYLNILNLSPGSYKFCVSATTESGLNKSRMIQKDFTVIEKKNIKFDLQGGKVDSPVMSYKVNNTNGPRVSGSIIMFNNANALINTNIYGREVQVTKEGTVSHIREYGDSNQMTVPTDGMIISGVSDSEFKGTISNDQYYGFNAYQMKVYVYEDYDAYLYNHKEVAVNDIYRTLPTPEKDGYYFKGWYTSPEGGSKITYFSDYTTDKLYAQWSKKPGAEASVEYNNHLYEVYDYPMSWKQAKEFCESKGGHLVTITSDEENEIVTNLISDCSQAYYAIGAESEETKGNWNWISGETFGYENWDREYLEGNTDTERFGYIISIDNPPNKEKGEWIDGYNLLNKSYGYYYYNNGGFVCETSLEKVCHVWDEGEIIEPATMKENGSIDYTCEICGNIKTTTIRKASTVKLSTSTCTYNGKVREPEVIIKDSKGNKISKDNYTISKPSGRKNAGEYVYKIKFRNKYSGSKNLKLTIKRKKITSVSLSTNSYVYNGKTKKPSVTVKAGDLKPAKGRKSDNSNIDITYAKGRTKVGSYKVTVKGKGNYTGTLTKKFKINPKATTITKLTRGSKSLTVKWSKKSSQVTGYQICYGRSKDRDDCKKVRVKSYKTTSKKITGLKKNKTYYVWVRTYKTVDGTRYYSSWSERKSKTTR